MQVSPFGSWLDTTAAPYIVSPVAAGVDNDDWRR
jgi:hypothetical protein